jgi:hypothetical protein
MYRGFKGSQKKKARQASAPDTYEQDINETEETSKKKSVFDTFLEEITKEDEPVPYAPVEVNAPTDKKEEPKTARYRDYAESKPFSYDDFYEESNYKEHSDVYHQERAATQPTIQAEKTTYLQKRRRPRIDLRKAVIYSEILNRRYF